jgi:hypothetical protein
MNDEQGLGRLTVRGGNRPDGMGREDEQSEVWSRRMWKPAKKKILEIVRTAVGQVRGNDTGWQARGIGWALGCRLGAR